MSGLDTYFVEMSAYYLLKVATKTSFRVRKSENLAFSRCFSPRYLKKGIEEVAPEVEAITINFTEMISTLKKRYQPI